MKFYFSALIAAVFSLLPISEFLPPTLNALWHAAVLTLVLFAVLFLRHRQKHPLSTAWTTAAICAALGVLVSSANASDFRAHWMASIPLLFILALGPTAIKRLVDAYPRTRSRVACAFLVGQTTSAVTAILQAVGAVPIFGELQLVGRSSGLAGHPNTLGLMAGIAICILVSLRLSTKKYRTLTTVLLAINIVALLTTGSVSALSATILGLTILIYASRMATTRIVLSSTAFILAVAAYTTVAAKYPQLPNPLARLRQVTGQTADIGSWDIRTDVYGYAFNTILKNPIIGVGMDYESGVFMHPLVGQALTHNILLRGWLQGGIFLFISFSVIYIATMVLIRGSQKKSVHALSCGVLALVLAFALTSAALYQTYYWIVIVTAWGTAIRIPKKGNISPAIKHVEIGHAKNIHAVNVD